MTDKLDPPIPCPFCGSSPREIPGTYVDGEHFMTYGCSKTGCPGYRCPALLDEWNTRVQPSPDRDGQPCLSSVEDKSDCLSESGENERQCEIRVLDLEQYDPIGWVNMPHEDKTPGKRVVGYVFQDKWPTIQELQILWDSRIPEPVSVSLEKCARAIEAGYAQNKFGPTEYAKAVLDAAGVAYVE